MTATSIPVAGPSGVLRMTWVRDQLAHVLDHCDTDEPSGTWTGLACPDHGLALGADVDMITLHWLSARGEIADLIWEAPADLAAGHGQLFQAAIHAYNAGNSGRPQQLWDKAQVIWSQASAANHAVLELVQHAGLTRFSPVKPQRWVVASFEHHCGPHGLPQPHVHNIVLTDTAAVVRDRGVVGAGHGG